MGMKADHFILVWAFFMAKDKKSFLLYADQKSVFEQLPDEIAGRLIKHIFSYVNDENPQTEELIIKIAFEPIRLQLKRDLQKYEGIRERNSVNARKRWDATASNGIPKDTKNADTDTDNDNDNVTDNDIINKRDKSLLVGGNKLDMNLVFDEVWSFYTKNATRQVGSKKDARLKFMRLKSNEIESLRVHLPKFVKNHLEAKKADYLPNFTTYLNQRRYEDEKMPYPSAGNKLEDYLNQFKGL